MNNFINTIQALAFHVFSNLDSNIKHTFDHASINQWIQKFTLQFQSRLSANGPTWTLNRYKSIYNWLKGKVLGVKNFQSLLNPFIMTTKQGIPLELAAIKHLLSGDSPWIRVIMTVLRLFESIKLLPKFDESSITDGYTGKPIDPIVKDFKSFLQNWFKKFGKAIRRKLELSKLSCHELSFRFKSGPMGPSILTSHLCALAIWMNQTYYEIFMGYYDILHSETNDKDCIIKQFGHSIRLCTISVGDQLSLITGKISLASEPAGKTRLFAICNFWVQTILKPLHDALMQALKLFPTDGTFDQTKQFNRILLETKGKSTYCFDLTKATDRFPIILQQVLLGVIVNEQFAQAWMKLISHLPFRYNHTDYFWKVGQPLGAFSSWAMFALTHHFVVQYCYFKVTNRLKWFNDYALLGDDIVIWHSKVAQYYLSFMSDIGVSINLQKSYIGLSNTGEFAKRHFVDGRNISGFGYSMIKQASASLIGWIRFLEILELEDFTALGGVLLLPGNHVKELSFSMKSQLAWLWTLRNCFAHNWLLSYGNITLSQSNLLEYYILERIELLSKQANSCLNYKDFRKLTHKIVRISKSWGVAVKLDCLDIAFIGDELVSHPLVRYLNLRNNIIFVKIEQFNNLIKDSLWSSSDILMLSSYSQEEYIPSLTLDTFFADNLNEVKHKLKTSIQIKSVNKLMKSIK